jgi:SAM-dependent methyltransferase
MLLSKFRTVFKVARGAKFFLNLEVGVTRDETPQKNVQIQKSEQKFEKQLQEMKVELSRAKEEWSSGKGRGSVQSEVSGNKRDGVTYDGVFLPPPNLRPTRRGRQGEEVYFEATRQEVDWMVENLGLSTRSSLLDLGCGSGRIALGVLDRVGEIREYRGLDVDKRFLRWARNHITPEHPNFQFIHLDAKNEYYNPEGTKMGYDLTLPFAEGEFDIICLFSVFTHMLTDDVKIYLKELHRILHPDGKAFMTANLEDGVPDVEENPIGYRGKTQYRNPLATVRYNREFFENLLEESGFHLESYDHPELRQAQRCLTVSKKKASSA